MSSTNRKNSSDRHISDYYITPVSEISLFLKELNSLYYNHLHNGFILEPCSGGDSINPMSYVEALKEYNNKITTIDIRSDSKAEIIGNYLQMDCKNKYDLIITNPPFIIAQQIISKALEDVKDNGIVVMLLRLNYFGSKDRKSFWDKYMPEYCFVHHKRMSFIAKGGTDSIEYCHMVWKKGFNTEYTKLKVI